VIERFVFSGAECPKKQPLKQTLALIVIFFIVIVSAAATIVPVVILFFIVIFFSAAATIVLIVVVIVIVSAIAARFPFLLVIPSATQASTQAVGPASQIVE
jgi:hypothetical protein